MIGSCKKAIERIKAGARVVRTLTIDDRSSGALYSLSDTGEAISPEAMGRLMPKLLPLNDGLFDGESQTFTLRPDS